MLELSWDVESVALRRPLVTAYGEVCERPLVRVRVRAGELEGHGEAAPLPAYDGVEAAEVTHALAAHAAVLASSTGASPGERLQALQAASPLPWALAAVECALWDLAGQREGRTVAELLAESPAAAVPVNATLGAEDPKEAGGQAAAAARAGFRAVKLKLGVGDDVARISAVRAATGPGVELRGDANGAWTLDQAAEMLPALGRAGLDLIEEPVHGVAGLRALRGSVPGLQVAMDETGALPGAAMSGAADVIVLKLGRAGGLGSLLASAALASAAGSQVIIASSLDGPVGTAAAIHAAAALGITRPCGLATLGLLACEDVLAPQSGAIAVPRGPGLGVRHQG